MLGPSQILQETGEEHDRCVQRSCKFSVIITGCACEYEKRIQVRVGNFETTADQRAVNPIQPPPLDRDLRDCQGLAALEETLDQYRLRVHLENALLASKVVQRVLLSLGPWAAIAQVINGSSSGRGVYAHQFLHVGRVTIRIEDDRARTSNRKMISLTRFSCPSKTRTGMTKISSLSGVLLQQRCHPPQTKPLTLRRSLTTPHILLHSSSR